MVIQQQEVSLKYSAQSFNKINHRLEKPELKKRKKNKPNQQKGVSTESVNVTYLQSSSNVPNIVTVTSLVWHGNVWVGSHRVRQRRTTADWREDQAFQKSQWAWESSSRGRSLPARRPFLFNIRFFWVGVSTDVEKNPQERPVPSFLLSPSPGGSSALTSKQISQTVKRSPKPLAKGLFEGKETGNSSF